MRFGLLAAGVAACALSVPAGAATIVQSDSEFRMLGFAGFNPALGRLDSVSLSINVIKYRSWTAITPVDQAGPITADWTINGIWRVPGSTLPGGMAYVTLTGAGSKSITPSGPDYNGLRYNDFFVTVTGSTIIALNPADFMVSRFTYDGADAGRYAPDDTVMTGTPGVTFRHNAYGCQNNALEPEDFCGFVNYGLTYNYTPAAELAVPEPATWGMMLLGFGVVGAGMRRRRVPHSPRALTSA